MNILVPCDMRKISCRKRDKNNRQGSIVFLKQNIRAIQLYFSEGGKTSVSKCLCLRFLDDVMFRAEGKRCDIFSAVFFDDDNIVFSVSSGAWLSLGDHDHGFHGDDHVGLQHGVDVFSQLQTWTQEMSIKC